MKHSPQEERERGAALAQFVRAKLLRRTFGWWQYWQASLRAPKQQLYARCEQHYNRALLRRGLRLLQSSRQLL